MTEHPYYIDQIANQRKKQTHKKLVCIVIPVYREFLTKTEEASLKQCLNILRNYPIYLAKPEKVSVSEIIKNNEQIYTESFQDDFFHSIDGYNRLMLSDQFYSRFKNYEYMLLYQLDAFVFSDQLSTWCGLEYDYVGAPWLPKKTIPKSFFLLKIKRKLYQWLNIKNRAHNGLHHMQYDYLSGNGGMSLRRISAIRQTLFKLNKRITPYLVRSHHSYNEDIFFSVESNRYKNNIKTPPFSEAIYFSWESHPATALEYCNGILPFGCHGWNKLHKEQWCTIFSSIGYKLDKILD